jgi:hypothetical protein
VRLGETGNLDHQLEERGGETGIEAAIVYNFFAENGSGYEREVPFQIGAGEQLDIPWIYTPVSSDESFNWDYSDGEVTVDHPVEIEQDGDIEVTFEATPNQQGTSTDRLL